MGLLSFFDRFKAYRADRSPWGDFYFEPTGARSVSGMRVSADAALRLAAVYACVRILSETMASLPIVIYRTRPDGGKDRIKDHWLYHRLARTPNRYQNPFEWREMLQGHLTLRGNAYCQILANAKGEITELLPIHPDRVKLEMLTNGDYRYRISQAGGAELILPRGEVWHLRGLSSDGLLGMSPIELARESLGMALAAQDYGARFFANDAKPTGGWIEFPGNFKDAEAKRVFRESYQQAQAGANRGKVLVLENGMKFHEVGVTNKDAQFLELRKFQITDIARLFRVPPHMIADLDRATFSNIEQQSLEFVMHTMTPWAALRRSLKIKSVEALSLAEQYRRHANGVVSDMIVSSMLITEEDFASIVQNGHPPGYTNFRDFIQGDYTYQRALFRAILKSNNADRGYIDALRLTIDVPDIFDRGVAEITNSATGITVQFSRSFRFTPQVTMTHKGGTTTAIPRILGTPTTSGFTAVLEDKTGARVSGSFSWLAQGC